MSGVWPAARFELLYGEDEQDHGAPPPSAPPRPLLTLNSRWVAEGDSITAGSNGPQWATYADIGSRGRFFRPLNWNQATGGQTAAQMATQIAQVTALNPKVVTFLAGTNDLGSTSDTPAAIYGNIRSCVKGYLDGGAQYVVVSRVLPRSDTTWTNLGTQPQREADRKALNTLIEGLPGDPALSAYSRRVIVTPSLEATWNPATDTIEGLHPNYLGAIKLGNSFATALNSISDTSLFSDLYLDPSNALLAADNPQLAGTTGVLTGATGEVATGWTVSQNDTMTVAASKTTMGAAAAQRIQVSGTNATAGRVVNFSNPCQIAGAIGDSFEACIDFILAAGSKNLRGLTLGCGSTGLTPLPSSPPLYDGAPALNGTLRTPVIATLAAAVTSVTVQATLTFAAGTVAADVTWSRPYFRKVPAGSVR
ncbi:SGNH/GDSL hydrolase family protein [Bradyrhizobium sp. Leo121]|uniref:SGNH/GDSL hydrolase family protein n=1 Tax=Bradyrhizobium sp. Leo121 TaxID=1571195 RepID=UPI0013EF54E2|nr:SGNH/GDSL hydrolase family protein [Bradyrhizobium sp. Leo121]